MTILTLIKIQNRLKRLKKQPGLVVFSFILMAISLSSTAAEHTDSFSRNQLSEAASPYLAMHAQDPVFWQAWRPEVLTEAKRQQKPILLSSGYFSCHWCHIMQRENYQDATVAKLINRNFIAVKIDRELLPDTDQTLIQFARTASGHAGWPQHVILTPEGLPFYAFVYQPKAILIERLQRVSDLWHDKPDQIRRIAQQSLPVAKALVHQPLTLDSVTFIKLFNQQLTQQLDDLSGGLQTSQKFPRPVILQTLLNQKNLPESLQAWLKLTLDQMQSQGLYDAVHGGFFRYTIDPDWQTPHFEKMLTTQALLAKLYFDAANHFQDNRYLHTARQTLRYVEIHLWNPQTQLFMSSQSAIDFQNVEGGAYLWSRQALQQQLDPTEFQFLIKQWQLDQSPPFEAGWLPKPTAQFWPSIQTKLRRSPAEIPTDGKSILGWNGLMLSAYAAADASDPEHSAHYHAQARQLINRLQAAFESSTPPRAFSRQGRPIGQASLQDTAWVIQGLKDWRAEGALLRFQKNLMARAEKQFLTSRGWQLSVAPLLPGQIGHWATPDNEQPSATALLDCQRPQHLAQAQQDFKTNPLDYASYAATLNCIDKETR